MTMGLWNKLTGTKHPDAGTALLALNAPGVPYRVRNALPAEKADLVAECHIQRVGVRLKTRMRLVPDKQEVRFLHERWENRSAGNAGTQYGRGHAPAVFRQWETRQGPDGKRHKIEAFRFDTREMTDPLQNAVLDAGWTWRGALKL
ncbi:hypothetical protein GCM10010358_81710 [Streptomyces minutiscleroticus]|uniref:Uncharacterized protein n=1 Tax=Streptomyces minutiscleroticus TaxID=68238 RepID=A0A918UAP4_9ACTN|nr:hypothetical protein [Streptomyces minutiscleroticus]GGY18037.1 hypothetical protein GCM10010358_81710 [Streptomyces minutiscleroticus]